MFGAVALVSVGSANATVNGTGWQWHWEYTDAHHFVFDGTLFGVSLVGDGTDFDGIRQLNGTLRDTDPNDGACASVKIFGPDKGEIFRDMNCDGPPREFHTRGFTGADSNQVVFELNAFKDDGDGGVGWAFRDRIQSSIMDPNRSPIFSRDDFDLRTPGSGAFWFYTGATTVHFGAFRPGLRIDGDAHHELPFEQRRTASATLETTAPEARIRVDGYLWGEDHPDSQETTVTRGDPRQKIFGRSGFDGPLYYEACRSNEPGGGAVQQLFHLCIRGRVPLPML